MTPCRNALEAKAAAEFAAGNEVAGVNDLVLLLEIGRQMRNSAGLLRSEERREAARASLK